MTINARNKIILLLVVVAAVLGLLLVRCTSRGPAEQTAPVQTTTNAGPVEIISAMEIRPQELLSDAPAAAPSVIERAVSPSAETNGTTAAGADDPGGTQPVIQSVSTQRVVLSRVFAPYALPSSMMSYVSGSAGSTSTASGAFSDYKKWAEAQESGAGAAYLNLATMLGAAPTEQMMRRSWIEVPALGSDTNLSPVLAMITREPDAEKPAQAVEQASAERPESMARVMYYVREGDAKMSEGLLEEAARAYADALALYPELTYASEQMGRLNLMLGKYDDAIKNLTAALAASEDVGETLNDLGIAYLYAGRAGEALETFEAAMQAAPEQVDAVFNIGLALRQLGQLAEAREQFNTYLQISPRDARAMRELAVIDLLENQRETALRRLILAIEYDGAWATPMMDAALLFAEMGVYDRAVVLLERALEHAPVRDVYQVYMQKPFEKIRLGPDGKPFEAKLAAKARAGM